MKARKNVERFLSDSYPLLDFTFSLLSISMIFPIRFLIG